IDPRLPRELDAWVARALSLDSAARFPSATAMANAYLAELDKAKLLPYWAAPREGASDRRSYTSDPGGISGGPIVLRRTGMGGVRGLVLGALLARGTAVAAPPREDFVTFASGWVSPFGELPRLHPAPEEPALTFRQSPRLLPPPSSSALAPRDIVRTAPSAP